MFAYSLDQRNWSVLDIWGVETYQTLYAAVRFTEAYGLWLKRRWAEWLAALSGSIYIPFEILKLRSGVEPLPLGALVLNIAIVLLMISVLLRAPQSPR